jgi:DNA-binding XRE family transcriptional regulator
MSPLRNIRHSLGWTQERMAQELGVSLRTYCRQERLGGSKPLQKLASMIYVNQTGKTQTA